MEGPIIPKHLNSAGLRAEWWQSLDKIWQKIFIRTLLGQNPDSFSPGDRELVHIITTPVIRIVGTKGPNPSIDFDLVDLKGLSHLHNLEIVIAMYCNLQSLKGIEKLTRIKSLFVNNNALSAIQEVKNLELLEELYCSSNLINSIHPINQCHKLRTLYCSSNHISSLKGISKHHMHSLRELYCLPNEAIPLEEIRRIERLLGIQCKSIN